jgi:hypothetical protein
MQRSSGWFRQTFVISTTFLGVLLALGVSSPVAQATNGTDQMHDRGTAMSSAAQATDGDWRVGWEETARWGGRLGYVDKAGTLWVQLRYQPEAPWVPVAAEVAQFQLLDWRLAVLKRDGTLWLGEGPLNAPLVHIDAEVSAFQLTLTRVGMLRKDGTFRVKEWGGEPTSVATGVHAFQVLDDRVAVLGVDGTLWMQRGGTVHGFVPLATGVDAFQMEREWVAYRQDARLMVARDDDDSESLIDLAFQEVAAETANFEMEVTVTFNETFDSRMHLAVVDAQGQLWLDEAAVPEQLALSPVDLGGVGPLARVQWAGGQLAALGLDGTLTVAQLDETGGLVNAQAVVGVKDFRLGPEGTLLLSSKAGRVSLIHQQLLDEKGGWQTMRDEAELSSLIMPGAQGAAGRSFDLAGEKALAREKGGRPVEAAAGVGLSSLRPAFTRQPVMRPGTGTDLTAAPVVFSDAGLLDSAFALSPALAEGDMGKFAAESDALPGPLPVSAKSLPTGTVLRFQRYSASLNDHMVSASAHEGQRSGYTTKNGAAYYSSAATGRQPVYRCLNGRNHFVSLRADCEGRTSEGRIGYLLIASKSGHNALYRCRAGTDHFVSSSSTCGGHTNEGRIGYSPRLYEWPRGTSRVTYETNYVNNYKHAAGGWWNGHFFPNIVHGGVTWYGYVAHVVASGCWDTGYAKYVGGLANHNNKCTRMPTGYLPLPISGRLSASSVPFKVVPGEITADQFSLIPLEGSIDRTYNVNGFTYNAGWQRTLPTNATVLQRTGTYLTNLAVDGYRGPRPSCVGACDQIDARSVGNRLSDGTTRIWISGTGTSGNLWQDFVDIGTGVRNLNSGGGNFSQTYHKIVDYIWTFDRDPAKVLISSHSMGIYDGVLLGHNAWASQVFGFSPPGVSIGAINSQAMLDRPWVDFTFYSGHYDMISNGVLGQTNFERINAGVDLFTGNTGSFNAFNPFEPHFRDNYFNTFNAPSWTSF